MQSSKTMKASKGIPTAVKHGAELFGTFFAVDALASNFGQAAINALHVNAQNIVEHIKPYEGVAGGLLGGFLGFTIVDSVMEKTGNFEKGGRRAVRLAASTLTGLVSLMAGDGLLGWVGNGFNDFLTHPALLESAAHNPQGAGLLASAGALVLIEAVKAVKPIFSK